MPTSHHAIVRTLSINLWSKLPVKHIRRHVSSPANHRYIASSTAKQDHTTSNGHSIASNPTAQDLHIPLSIASNTSNSYIPQDTDGQSSNQIHASTRPDRNARHLARKAAKDSQAEVAVRQDSGVLTADTSHVNRMPILCQRLTSQVCAPSIMPKLRN